MTLGFQVRVVKIIRVIVKAVGNCATRKKLWLEKRCKVRRDGVDADIVNVLVVVAVTTALGAKIVLRVVGLSS